MSPRVASGGGAGSGGRVGDEGDGAGAGGWGEGWGGVGPSLAIEKRAEWGVGEVDHETLRRWLMGAGLWARARRRGPHRRWRERKRAFGELVQLDGPHHDWFGTGEQACLMNFVEEAT